MSDPIRKRWACASIACLTLLVGATLGSAQVYLRGESEALAADVVGAGPEGLSIKTGETVKIMSWDRVRVVKGSFGEAAARQASTADKLWRARTRLERGDFGGAESLLENLKTQYAGQAGPTAALVHDAAMRCSLHRGAQSNAVWSWLEWRQAIKGKKDAEWIGGKVASIPVVDREIGVLIALPPVFLADPALDIAAASDRWDRFKDADPTSRDLANLYRAAMRHETGAPVELGETVSDDSGVRLVREVVLARVGSSEQRAQARAALQARLASPDVEPWIECWVRLALGRSLVRESDPILKRQGVLHLLHVPARFSRLSAHMASVALAEAAVASHELGDQSDAEALKGELLDRFSRQPSANWVKLREIRRTEPSAGKNPEQGREDAGQ